jgi:hypothetical protein
METGHGRGITGFALLEVPVSVQVKISGTPQTTGQQLLRLKRVVQLIFQDSNVEKVVRLHGPPVSWSNLYKIFEVIEGDVGRLIVDLKWMTKSQITRFTQTAQSPQVIGDDARHGRQKQEPPKKSMILQQASELITQLTHRWIDHKLSQQSMRSPQTDA